MRKLAVLIALGCALVTSSAFADGDGNVIRAPVVTGSPTRGPGIALMAVGGAGVVVAGIIGVVALVDAAGHSFGCDVSLVAGNTCASHDTSGYAIGAGVSAAIGATFLLTGGILLSVAPKSHVSAQLGPTGGSLRFTF